MIEGAGDVDVEAYPIATSTKDASSALASICLAAGMATRTDDGSGYVTSAYDVVATPSRATAATGTPDTPSSACSPMDTDIGCASSVDTVVAPTPLMPSIGAAIAGS